MGNESTFGLPVLWISPEQTKKDCSLIPVSTVVVGIAVMVIHLAAIVKIMNERF